jgi:hypothetical protein
MFHNKKLQEIHEESKDAIKKYQGCLDQLSEDIKALEKLLQNSGISEFSTELERCKYIMFTDNRLQYLDQNKNPIAQNPRPLIEQKAVIRMEVAEYLPDFFEKCMNKIKSGVKNVCSN